MSILKLEDFIEDSISQIVNGITKAQEKIKKTGASINREGLKVSVPDLNGKRYDERTLEIEERINFDIAITCEENTETKGKISIGVLNLGLGLGSDGKSENKGRMLNKLNFSVPIIYPKIKNE